jgi:hypothetical protein
MLNNKSHNSKNSYKNMRKLVNDLNLCCQEVKQISARIMLIMSKTDYTKIPDKPGIWKQIRRTQSA